jgi:hypothetical protein
VDISFCFSGMKNLECNYWDSRWVLFYIYSTVENFVASCFRWVWKSRFAIGHHGTRLSTCPHWPCSAPCSCCIMLGNPVSPAVLLLIAIWLWVRSTFPSCFHVTSNNRREGHGLLATEQGRGSWICTSYSNIMPWGNGRAFLLSLVGMGVQCSQQVSNEPSRMKTWLL